MKQFTPGVLAEAGRVFGVQTTGRSVEVPRDLRDVDVLDVVAAQAVESLERPHNKEAIGAQLDAFAQEKKLLNLRDRLRIGLNEVAILAYDKTSELTRKAVEALVGGNVEEAEAVYAKLVEICVDMQQMGPWAYAPELANPTSPEIKAWFILAGAETIGYEREHDLSDEEFVQDVQRIEGHLVSAIQDPEDFFQRSHHELMRKSAESIRFEKEDKQKRVPMGEGFGSFLPMAIQGYEAGVVQDAEGWVYVGAREEIEDARICSVGLKAVVAPDERNSKRMVTYFENDKGQRVIKKIHPGLLVIQSRSFDLAAGVVEAINDQRDTIRIADEALGHTRVIQTTEKKRQGLKEIGGKVPEDFMRVPEMRAMSAELAPSRDLSVPRQEFYNELLYVRGMYVFMDALHQKHQKRTEEGKPVTDLEKQDLSERTWAKMEQKVDELRYLNGLLSERAGMIPINARKVVDMAGGAGDLGLAVVNEFLCDGRTVEALEVVDPQEGVAEFMETIIDHMPFREDLKRIATHNTGYLQDAKITPESIVVAKHACGTLTDDILSQWRESKSGMLMAMTCCQGKAASQPARYGFSQAEWERLCQESDLTNTEIPEQPGKARDRALERFRKGNEAMLKLDMARVEYLRRHGFQAELTTTDKFPKGDVIIARRLPENFMKKLAELQVLERKDPMLFDATMRECDLRAAGVTRMFARTAFGEEWTEQDFAELTRRFVATAYAEQRPANVDASKEKPVATDAGQEDKAAKARVKKLMGDVFRDVGGRIDLYIAHRVSVAGKKPDAQLTGKLVGVIKNLILREDYRTPEDIRGDVDKALEEMGY